MDTVSNPVTPIGLYYGFEAVKPRCSGGTWAFWALSGWSEIHSNTFRDIFMAPPRRPHGDRKQWIEEKVLKLDIVV